MGDTLKKVQPGDTLKIPAATFNTFIDAARDFQQRQQNRGQQKRPQQRQGGIVPVKNASGADRARFDILGIDSPIFTPTDNEDEFKNRVALKCVTPDADTHVGRFVVLAEPIADGEIGLAYVHGVCPVKVDVGTDDWTCADIIDGDAEALAAAPIGAARILWTDGEPGRAWALVLLSGWHAEPIRSLEAAWTGGTCNLYNVTHPVLGTWFATNATVSDLPIWWHPVPQQEWAERTEPTWSHNHYGQVPFDGQHEHWLHATRDETWFLWWCDDTSALDVSGMAPPSACWVITTREPRWTGCLEYGWGYGENELRFYGPETNYRADPTGDWIGVGCDGNIEFEVTWNDQLWIT